MKTNPTITEIKRSLSIQLMSLVFTDIRDKYSNLVKDSLTKYGVPKETTVVKCGRLQIHLAEFTWYGGPLTSVYVIPDEGVAEVLDAVDNYKQFKSDYSTISSKLSQWVEDNEGELVK